MSASARIDSVVVVVGRQVSASVSDETVVLGLDKGMYYGLDGVGRRIWELVQQPILVADIRDAIALEWDVDAITCERDLLVFLDELLAEDLIEIR